MGGGQCGLLNILPIWACLSQCSTAEGTCIGGPGQARPASEAGIQLTCRLLSEHTLLATMASLGGKDLDLEKSWQRHVRKDGKALHLAQQALVKVPAKVFTLPGLVELDLSRNCLETLPRQIQVLSALQVLNLSWNSLCQLPNEICSLKALKTLALDFNKLTCLPDEIGKLSKLRKIQVSSVRFDIFPWGFCQVETFFLLTVCVY